MDIKQVNIIALTLNLISVNVRQVVTSNILILIFEQLTVRNEKALDGSNEWRVFNKETLMK